MAGGFERASCSSACGPAAGAHELHLGRNPTAAVSPSPQNRLLSPRAHPGGVKHRAGWLGSREGHCKRRPRVSAELKQTCLPRALRGRVRVLVAGRGGGRVLRREGKGWGGSDGAGHGRGGEGGRPVALSSSHPSCSEGGSRHPRCRRSVSDSESQLSVLTQAVSCWLKSLVL